MTRHNACADGAPVLIIASSFLVSYSICLSVCTCEFAMSKVYVEAGICGALTYIITVTLKLQDAGQ